MADCYVNIQQTTTENVQQHLSDSTDCFRKAFKYYKRKKPPPNLENVLDMLNEANEKMVKFSLCQPDMKRLAGLLPVNEWKAYEHTDHQGFIFISNPFQCGAQRYWAKRCLFDYPCKPNHRNIDAHEQLADSDNVWLSQYIDDKGKKLIDHLRWVTLGYHHDWDTKKYSTEKRSEFPADLAYLSRYIASAVGFKNFTAEASIVNYYHFDSSLSGHTDHSEHDLSAPLVSISLGQTAIFLVGGQTRSVAPSAIYLRSGDIVVLSGASRLSYHAVPKVIKPVQQGWLPAAFQLDRDVHHHHHGDDYSTELAESDNDFICSSHFTSPVNEINKSIEEAIHVEDWRLFSEYLTKARININIRQVLKHSQISPNEPS